jgi:hypothetical protein
MQNHSTMMMQGSAFAALAVLEALSSFAGIITQSVSMYDEMLL